MGAVVGCCRTKLEDNAVVENSAQSKTMVAQVVDAVVQNESMDTPFADVVWSVAELSVQCFSRNSLQMDAESLVSRDYEGELR